MLLPIEAFFLVWQEWSYYRHDVDRYWMEEGDFWSGRVEGLLTQVPLVWGCGALVGAAYLQDSYVRGGVYLVLAFALRSFALGSCPLHRVERR